MTDTIIEHAPAKVNLALHVTGRRQDGYHLLDSLVIFTQAGDRISVCHAERDGFSIDGPFAAQLAGSEDNLVLRARDLMREMTGVGSPVAIVLEKNLPIASGIGGGSSDAAATIRALFRLWHVNIAEAEISERALALGADLPMCLCARPLIARGVGEDITIVDDLPSLAMVLVNPGISVSTPSVFRALASRENSSLPPLPSDTRFANIVQWLATTRNDLQPPAFSVAPIITDVLSALEHSGAALARMSGSGATCFGLFASSDAAARAAETLAASHPSWYVMPTHTIVRGHADVAR